MNWWNQALFDTCSVITLDKLRQEEPQIARHFSVSIKVIAATFSEDQLNEDTSVRMQPVLTLQEIPSNAELAKFHRKFKPSIALSGVMLRMGSDAGFGIGGQGFLDSSDAIVNLCILEPRTFCPPDQIPRTVAVPQSLRRSSIGSAGASNPSLTNCRYADAGSPPFLAAQYR